MKGSSSLPLPFPLSPELVSLSSSVFWVCMWYASSSLSNTIAKNLLSSYGFGPLTVFMVDTVPALFLVPWKNKEARKRMRRVWKEGAFIGGLALIAGLLHRTALRWAHVSTVHTAKATQPFFSAVLSMLILKETIGFKMCLSLLFVILGVLIGTYKPSSSPADHLEARSSLGILLAAVGTLFTALNAILSKKIFQNAIARLTSTELYSLTRSFAFLYVLPLWSFYDLPTLDVSLFLSVEVLPLLSVYSLLQILQHVSSLSVLFRLSPISHSVLNGFKRVFVICAGMMYFGNRVSLFNLLGVLISTAGVLWYSQIKREIRHQEKEGGAERKQIERGRPKAAGKEEMAEMEERMSDQSSDSWKDVEGLGRGRIGWKAFKEGKHARYVPLDLV